MKKIYYFLFALAIALMLNACGNAGNLFKQFIGEDPDPPEGYSPTFITTSKPFKADEKAKRTLQLSRTDPYKSDKVRLYLHLVQSDTIFLTDAASNANKKYWCEVWDSVNGKAHKITDFTIRQSTKGDRTPRAIALVMDMSGSMGEMRAKAVEEAVYNFLKDTKSPDDKVALIKYDDSVGVECVLTGDRQELLSKLYREGLGTYGKQTSTLDAISVGIDEVSKADSKLERVVMVFTDGQDNSSHVSKSTIIEKARRFNAMICTIDYGYMIQEDFLEDIAKQTNGTYTHIYQSQEFDLVFKDIYHRLEDFYIIEYEPPDYGDHKVFVKLCMPAESLMVDGNYNNKPYAGMVKLIDVYFDTGKATLKSESNKAIKIMYEMLVTNPSMVIELQGHTDSQGDDKQNQKLSEDRAKAVRDALIAKGINGSRMTAKGYGETVPIADNASEEGRAKNRRTVFVVVTQ